MKALLWFLVIGGAINTLALGLQAFTGGLKPIPMYARAADWAYTFAIGAWALWLLASGV